MFIHIIITQIKFSFLSNYLSYLLYRWEVNDEFELKINDHKYMAIKSN